MLAQDMDNLQQNLQLIDSYLLLDGTSIVQVSVTSFSFEIGEALIFWDYIRQWVRELAMPTLRPYKLQIRTTSKRCSIRWISLYE